MGSVVLVFQLPGPIETVDETAHHWDIDYAANGTMITFTNSVAFPKDNAVSSQNAITIRGAFLAASTYTLSVSPMQLNVDGNVYPGTHRIG